MRHRPTILPTLRLLGGAVVGVAAPLFAAAGLTLLVIAAFSVSRALGFAVAGVACFALAVYVEVWRSSADAGTVVERRAGAPGAP